ncbi:uncharacterized protein LOC126252330 [Schistocerca nitens]|uniref:uncharacterized protein LOC126252330 n=1 Tax=Schistocerca nitens TaxID=7011 RepID=UPI0021190262|nr:uncharacterized protein LOC126252330 [Schistocerca nitens]
MVSGCRDLGEQAAPRHAAPAVALQLRPAAPRLHRPLPRLPLPFAHRLLSDALQVAAASWVTDVDGRTQTGTWERKEPSDLDLKSTAHRHDVMSDSILTVEKTGRWLKTMGSAADAEMAMVAEELTESCKWQTVHQKRRKPSGTAYTGCEACTEQQELEALRQRSSYTKRINYHIINVQGRKDRVSSNSSTKIVI